MRVHVLAAFAALEIVVRAQADERRCPPVGDLGILVRCAQSSSDALVRARGGLNAARARREAAGRFLPSNPVLEIGAGRRRAESGAAEIDRNVELAQTLEIGGQRGARVEAADAELRAASTASDAATRDLTTDVMTVVAEVVRARRALAIVRDQREAADRLREVSSARARKGVAAPMDVELAEAARIQSLRDERVAAQALSSAESELAAEVGEDVRLIEPAELPRSSMVSKSLADLEQAALLRPEVVSAREDAAAARAQISLLRRERVPDVTVAAGYRHEEFSDVIGARLSVPLPVFRRNGPEITAQEARTSQAESATRQASLRATLAVRSAYASWQRAQAAAEAISPELDTRLRDDVVALQDAYQRGTMPLTQVLAALREAQAARRTLLDTRADAVRSSLEVNRAAGLPSCLAGECP